MGNITYKDAGVDIDAGDEFVEGIQKILKNRKTKGLISGVGGFSALFEPDFSSMKRPVLVSSTDGVGTKLKLAFLSGIHNTVGVDLVAMCVNDILTTGAKPLFFLDYFATSSLAPETSLKVIEGIIRGCEYADCVLVGGETAELPDFYKMGEYDLAGFCGGIVDYDKIVDGRNVREGDILVGLASSGLHSNGYSLVNKLILNMRKLDLNKIYEPFDKPLINVLLTETRIYVRSIMGLISHGIKILAMAHITGGGIESNVVRVIPSSLGAIVKKSSIPTPKIFRFIQGTDVSEDEIWRVFNMGVGFVLILHPEDVSSAMKHLIDMGEKCFVIGEIIKTDKGVIIQ